MPRFIYRHKKEMEGMPAMNFKTVILYDVRRIRPETLDRIQNAGDGEMIPVDVSEMQSFMPLVIHEPALKELRKPKKVSAG